jgi:hypothetical protein
VPPGCTKPGNSEGTISAGGAEGADRERNRSDGVRLLQVVQERDSVIEHAIEGCVDKHKWISAFPWTYAGMLKSSLANPATVAAALKDLNFWYVLAWLVPLGLCRLKTSAARMGYVIVHNGASRDGFHGISQ